MTCPYLKNLCEGSEDRFVVIKKCKGDGWYNCSQYRELTSQLKTFLRIKIPSQLEIDLELRR